MAGKQPPNSSSLERRPTAVSSDPPSELSASGPSDLQPFPPSRGLSPGTLSSYTVPVRLDVLYFLLSSAAKGAQNAQPGVPVPGGQGTFPAWHAPASPYAATCCGCRSDTHSAHAMQPSGGRHFGAGHGGCGGQAAGVPVSQNNRHPCAQQRDGKAWPGSSQPLSAGGCQRPPSLAGWKEKRGGGGHTWSNWPSQGPNVTRAWGDQRRGSAAPCSWKARHQGWRREEASFSSSSGSRERNHGESSWELPQDGPEAKRCPFGAGLRREKRQERQDPANFVGKATGADLAKAAAPDNAEDWEADYEKEQAVSSAPGSIPQSSFQEDHTGSSEASVDAEDKHAPSSDVPKPGSVSFSFPEVTSKERPVPTGGKEPSSSRAEKSKEGAFACYLKSLYSDLPGKSSSESSTELAIDTDVELSKSEEEWYPKDAAILGGDQGHPISPKAPKEEI